jgi:hypothetical protein
MAELATTAFAWKADLPSAFCVKMQTTWRKQLMSREKRRELHP